MTYGPCGWTVAVDYHAPQIRSTKCGARVLECFGLSDPCEDAGAHLLCHVALQVKKHAGDGTTLASVLAHAIAAESYRQNVLAGNQTEVYRGIRIASQMAEEFIIKQSKPLTRPTELLAVARSAAGLDDALVDLFVKAFTCVQDPSAVFLQPSQTSSCQVIDGLLLDAHSHVRFDHPCNSAVLVNPHIVIYPGVLETWDQINHDLKEAKASDTDVLIAAQRVCPTFRATIPAELDSQRFHFVSLAMSRLPYAVEELQESFRASSPHSSRRCVITNDKVFLELPYTDQATKEVAERVTRAALISIGEIGDSASCERMERAAQCAASVRAALDQGYVPGGAAILVDAAGWLGSQTVDDATTTIGIEILRQALLVPARTLIDSAGELGAHEVQTMLDQPSGGRTFDLRERRLCQAEEAGILDATAVVITALRVSSSVAGLIALTEVLVSQLDGGDRIRKSSQRHAQH